MRQWCSSCSQMVELPADAAGTTVSCPSCAAPLVVPASYSPTVLSPPAEPKQPSPPGPISMTDPTVPGDRPPPPPGFSPPPPPIVVAPGVPLPPGLAVDRPTTDPTPAGLTDRTLTLSPKVFEWAPVVLMGVVFILMFFSWVGAYPGGVRVFSQGLWDSIGGTLSPNTPSEDLQKLETELEKVTHTDWWMVIYFILFMVTTFLLVLDRVLKEPTIMTVPGPLAWLPGIWPRRYQLLVALSLVLLILLVLQLVRGFGLENAVKTVVTEKYTEEIAKADTSMKKQIAQIRIGQDYSRYAIQSTIYRDLVLLAHLAVVVSLLMTRWLSRRGAKPYPMVILRS